MRLPILLCMCLLVGLGGCATKRLSEYMDHTGWVQERPGTSLAGVVIVSSNGQQVLRSGIRFDGERGSAISWEDTVVGPSASAGSVEIRVVYPVEVEAELTEILSSNANEIDENLKTAVRVARAIIEDMTLLAHRPVQLNIFTSPVSAGYMLDIESKVDTGPIHLIIATPHPKSIGNPGWWAGALANSFHELTHVHQKFIVLQSVEEDGPNRKLINQETGAWIAQRCAEMAFYKTFSDELTALEQETGENPVLATWPVLDLTEAFPGLREGKFNPNVEAVEELDRFVSRQGGHMAEAVMYLFSNDGDVDLMDEAQNHEREEYCSYIFNNTPDFAAGDYMGELQPAAGRRD